MNQILEILKAEFTTYYTVSDLPKKWDESALKVELPRMAMESAFRLKRRAGVNNFTIESYLPILEEIEKTATNDFADMISGFNSPDWKNPEYQMILKSVVKNINDFLTV